MRLLPLPGVFRPLSDSWMLADAIERERIGPGSRVLDLCTGSGVLALTAARLGADSVAIDVSRRSVAAVRLNALMNGLRVRALRGDLFEPVRGERFDLIVSNPPYMPSETDELPHRGARRALDAGSDGRAYIDRICEQAPEHLRPGGVLLLIHSSVCGEAKTIETLLRAGLQPSVAFRHHGPLGPVLTARIELLSRRGLSDGYEDVIVIRGQRPPEPGAAPERDAALGGRASPASFR